MTTDYDHCQGRATPTIKYRRALLRHNKVSGEEDKDSENKQCLNLLRKNQKIWSKPSWGGGPTLSNSSTMWTFYLLLLCLILPHCINLSTFAEAKKTRRDIKYKWKTGSWDACASTSCGSGGVQLRPVNCVYARKEEWRVIHSNCDTASKPVDMRPCFKVCDDHRNMYEWITGPWEECHLVDSAPVDVESVDVCGLGFLQVGSQPRSISCVGVNDSTIVMENYVCEVFSPPPANTRACDVPCPLNCVTSHWGEWTRCSKTCGNGTQFRARNVLTRSKYGGTDCPSLSQSRPCPNIPKCEADPILQTFFKDPFVLKFGNWSECVSGRVELSSTSGGRRKNRKESRRRLAQLRMDLIGRREHHVTCLNGAGNPVGDSIIVAETCASTVHCEVTKWSEWTACYAPCGKIGNRTRTREIKTLPTGVGANDCPQVEEIRQCDIDTIRVRPCKKYTWVTGGWSNCNGIDNATCGGGIQERDVYCVVKDEITIHQASTAVAIGGKVGLAKWAKLKPVADSNCDQKYRPPVWQECDLACVAECQVGEWSDWSECAPEHCYSNLNSASFLNSLRSSRKSTTNGFKRRIRKMLESSTGVDGCPHMTEVIPCEDARCYRWHALSVSVCSQLSGSCGKGTQDQTSVCKDMWGKVVADQNCLSKPAAPTINSTLLCYVPCGSDCVITEWSSWSPCTQVCKRGRGASGKQTRRRQQSNFQTRFREVLSNPGPDGKACPNQNKLEQNRLCNQHRCSVYYWDVGRWGSCQVKDSVTPTNSAVGIRTSDMFMSDDGNSSGGHQPLSFPTDMKVAVCGVGYQDREVSCRKKDSGTVQDKLCGSKAAKPVISRDCTFPCPKDCIVSEWSDWSSCEDECDKVAKPGIGSPGPVHQRRHRVVVQHRTERGTPCPIELNQKRQCIETERCMLHRWHSSKWSECALISKATSIYNSDAGSEVKCIGAMTRKVQCRQFSSSGESLNVEHRFCMKYADRSPPEGNKYCLAKCKPDVNFAMWQQKIGCLATVRRLDEAVESLYIQPTESTHSISHVSLQKTAKPVGKWSSCNITVQSDANIASLLGKKIAKPYCGTGIRRRALACYVEGTNIIVDNSYCHYRDFQQESCEIPCPVDCKLSAWASWGKCGDNKVGRREKVTDVVTDPPCGENLRMRYQFANSEPQHGGRACPILDSLGLRYETDPCSTICNTMFWVPNAWGACVVNEYGSFSNCGSGQQFRSSKCFESDRATGYANVANIVSDIRLCDVESMPFGSRSCSSPCPGECVYSDWSSWQPCRSNTGSKIMNSCTGMRKRSRNLLRRADPRSVIQHDTSLPDFICSNEKYIEEEETCALNENCFTFSTMWTEWSSCLLPSGAKCGSGRKERRSNCVSSNGLPVHKDKCLTNNVTVPDMEMKKCKVACPVDCGVSSWSSWSRCSDICGSAMTRKRTREIKIQPSRIGLPCPVTMETSPCPPKPCHHWRLGDWTECRIAGGNCGTGVQFRQVICEQHDGVLVSNDLCKAQQGDLDEWFGDSQFRRDCQIACAGECHMIEWSVWSDCHLRCVDIDKPVAGVTHGLQTRSRVGFILGQMNEGECPSQQVEERTCAIGDAKCFIYGWKTGTFYKGKRPVWCQRTIDGLNVSHGCHDQLKPQEELYCIQNCENIKYSYCTNEGICDCDAGYRAISETNGYLRSCMEEAPNDEASNVLEVDVLEEIDARNMVPKLEESTVAMKIMTPEPVEITTSVVVKKSGFFESLGMFKEDGTLKAWVYGVIAGLAIFFIFITAVIYLICVSCCRKKKAAKYAGGLYSTHTSSSKRRKRRHNSSGSNVGVGMVIGMGTPRFPPSGSAMSHTSSTSRSGFYADHYGSDILWKET